MSLFAFLLPFLAAAALPVIDAHTHTEFTGQPEPYSKIPFTAEQYLKELRAVGGVGAITHRHKGAGAPDPSLASFPVFQCYGVRMSTKVADVEKELKSKNARCIKIYLGYVHRFAYDPAYQPIYQLAARYDVPVVFHTGDTYSKKAKLKYADPLTIDEVAVDNPKTTFVIAHLGNPWIDSAMEVVYKNENVFVEASGMMIGNILEDPAALETFMVAPMKKAFGFIGNADKLMFGTDWPLASIGDYVAAYKKAIPEKHWCKVFYQNAVKVFRLKELEGIPCSP